MKLWQCYQNSYFGSASLKFEVTAHAEMQIFNAFDNLLTNIVYVGYTYCEMKLIDNLFNFTTWLVLKKVSDP